MGFNLPLLTTALAGVGGAFGNRAEKQRQKSSQRTDMTPEQQALLDRLIQSQIALTQDPDLSGYEASQTSDINHMADLQKQNLQDTLSVRGITGPAAGLAEANVDSQRFGNITRLRQGTPLLRNQLQTQNLNTSLNLFGSMPRNVTSESEGENSGNVIGGGISNAAITLAHFLGQGAFSKPTPPIAPPQVPVKAPVKPASRGIDFGAFFPPNYGRVNRTPNYFPGY